MSEHCSHCHSLGIIQSISKKKDTYHYLDICSCVESKCVCNKKVPYMYFDQQKESLQNCYCRVFRKKLETINLLFQKSNIPKKYKYRRLDEFKIHSSDPKITQCLAEAQDNAYFFLDEIKSYPQNFIQGWYFYGNPGTGKTFLACLMANECIISKQISVLYIKITRDFFNKIRSSYNMESHSYGQGEDFFNTISNVDVLVIDDFGVQKDSDWEQRMLYDLVDARYESEKITIITSNLNPKEISPLFSGRIYSRLKEMTRIQDLIAPDYRDSFQD